jgi:predicted DNA-binding transcriptional regulator AlpA
MQQPAGAAAAAKKAEAQTVDPTTAAAWHIKEVAKFFGGTRPLHPATVHRLVRRGVIPAPIKVGPQISRWIPEECRRALEAMIAARDAAG